MFTLRQCLVTTGNMYCTLCEGVDNVCDLVQPAGHLATSAAARSCAAGTSVLACVERPALQRHVYTLTACTSCQHRSAARYANFALQHTASGCLHMANIE